jgi:hypothetical protein
MALAIEPPPLFSALLHEDRQKHGKDVLTATRKKNPVTYLKVVASLLVPCRCGNLLYTEINVRLSARSFSNA